MSDDPTDTTTSEVTTITEPPVITSPKGRVTKTGHYNQDDGSFTIS